MVDAKKYGIIELILTESIFVVLAGAGLQNVILPPNTQQTQQDSITKVVENFDARATILNDNTYNLIAGTHNYKLIPNESLTDIAKMHGINPTDKEIGNFYRSVIADNPAIAPTPENDFLMSIDGKLVPGQDGLPDRLDVYALRIPNRYTMSPEQRDAYKESRKLGAKSNF